MDSAVAIKRVSNSFLVATFFYEKGYLMKKLLLIIMISISLFTYGETKVKNRVKYNRYVSL